MTPPPLESDMPLARDLNANQEFRAGGSILQGQVDLSTCYNKLVDSQNQRIHHRGLS